MAEASASVYCIDTSSILHAWRRDYPPDVFRSLWEGIEELIDAGLLIAPEEVLLELSRGGDDVYDWAKSHKEMFIQPDNHVQGTVKQIVNDYPEFLPQESIDGVWADPYVIALAEARGAVVVTGEKPVGAGARAPKIPNVCIDRQVPYTDVLGMLRGNGYLF